MNTEVFVLFIINRETESLRIKTRLIDERFASVVGECVIVTL